MEAKFLSEERLFSNKDLWKLFIPLIIEQFLEYLVGLADSIMVSSVGEASVSGVSSSSVDFNPSPVDVIVIVPPFTTISSFPIIPSSADVTVIIPLSIWSSSLHFIPSL